MKLLKWSVNFFLHPREAFSQAKKSKLSHAFTYFLTLLVINTILSGLVYASFGLPQEIIVQSIILVFITGLAGSLITGLWIFLWARLLGGRGLKRTISLVFYGSTPYLLIGWLAAIPEALAPMIVFLRLALIIWSFVLYGLGLQTVLGMKSSKAWIASAASLASGFTIIFLFSLFVLYSVIPLIFSLSS